MLPSSFFQRRVSRMGGADVLSEGLGLEADVASSQGDSQPGSYELLTSRNRDPSNG